LHAPGVSRIFPLTIFGHKDHVVFAKFIGNRTAHGLLTATRDGTAYCWSFRENERLAQEREKGWQEDKGNFAMQNTEDSVLFDDEEEEEEEEEEEDDDDDDDDEASERKGQNTLVCADVRLSSKHNCKQGGARHMLAARVHEDLRLLVVGLSNGIFALYELPVEMTERDKDYERALFDRPRTTAPYSELVLLQSLSMSSDPITTITVNETGEWLGVGVSSLGQLIVWEWRSETHVLKQQGHLVGGTSLAFSPDGRAIVTGGEDGRVKIWAVQSGFCTVTFSEHDAAVTDVAFSKTDVVLSSSLDGTVRVYDARRYRCFRVLVGPPPRRQFASVTADSAGEIVAAGCRDSFEVIVWSLRTGRVLDVISGHTGPVSCLAFHPTRGQLATGSWDATVRLWEVYSDTASEVLQHDKEVLALTYRPDGKELAVATRNGEVTLWDPENSRVKGSIDAGRDSAPGRLRDQRTVAAAKGFFRSICYSGDGRFLLGGGDANVICGYTVADSREPALIHRFEISVNKSLDGVSRKISTRELTDAAVGKSAIEDLDEGADDYEMQKRILERSLPGVESDRMKRRAMAHCVRFSPTSRAWAAMTSEGLLLYSAGSKWTQSFDPTALEVDITAEAAEDAAARSDYPLAIQIAIRYGDSKLLSDLIYRTPVEAFSSVLQGIEPQHFEKLLTLLVSRIEQRPYVGFDLEFTQALLLEFGYRGLLGDLELVSAIRALQRSVSAHWDRLSGLCESNGHKIDFILSQCVLPKGEEVNGLSET